MMSMNNSKTHPKVLWINLLTTDKPNLEALILRMREHRFPGNRQLFRRKLTMATYYWKYLNHDPILQESVKGAQWDGDEQITPSQHKLPSFSLITKIKAVSRLKKSKLPQLILAWCNDNK
jgi:hypothetical protein